MASQSAAALHLDEVTGEMVSKTYVHWQPVFRLMCGADELVCIIQRIEEEKGPERTRREEEGKGGDHKRNCVFQEGAKRR